MHIGASVLIGIRTARRRLSAIASVVAAAALAAATLLATFAVCLSFAHTAAHVGNPDLRLVQQVGAVMEPGSFLSRDVATRVINRLGIRTGSDGEPLVSTEVVRIVPAPSLRTGLNVFSTLRGADARILAVRPEMRIVEGRFPRGGTREMMVGRGLAARLGVTVGTDLDMTIGRWHVVGIFSSEEDAHESELIADINDVKDALRLKDFSSVVYLPSDSEPSPEALTQALQRDGLQVVVNTQSFMVRQLYRPVTQLLYAIAYGLAALILVALLVGILNTFLITVRKRATELATLRALGFDRASLIVAVIAEAMVCGLLGALVGALAVRLLFEGAALSLYSGMDTAQLSFDLHVGPALVIGAMGITVLVALLVGAIGALQVFSVTPATALRRV